MFLLIFLACTYLTTGRCKLIFKKSTPFELLCCFIACVQEIGLFEMLFQNIFIYTFCLHLQESLCLLAFGVRESIHDTKVVAFSSEDF